MDDPQRPTGSGDTSSDAFIPSDSQTHTAYTSSVPTRHHLPDWSGRLISFAPAIQNAQSLVANGMSAAPPSMPPFFEPTATRFQNEVQQRLNSGFKPPLQLTNGLLSDDWDLLKRVSAAPKPPAHSNSLVDFPFTSASMKRSASENSLETMNNSQGNRKHSKSSWAWEQQQGLANWPPAFVSSSQYAEAHAQALQAMVRKPVGLLPASEQQAAQESEDSVDAAAAFDNFLRASPILKGRHSHQPSTSSNGMWSNALDRPRRQGMPRVPTAPTLQELSETLNNSAYRNLEAVRAALQNAHASIQETANNCQQNLATLSNLFQGGSNPLTQALTNTTRTMVALSVLNNGVDPMSYTAIPWQVFPKVLRAREMESSGLLLTNGSATDTSEGVTESNRGALFDFVSPLEQYMSQLNMANLRQKRKAGSLRDPGRQVAIVTTACLPWLTGTSVNPLLRAAYLATDTSRKVTLVVPWLSPADQQRVFPADLQFDTPEEQEEYVRNWARQRTGLDCNFKISFYPGRYAAEKGSILPVGDITQVIPDHEADVAVLEEPEHLNWYHHGTRWTDKFAHVVGVMHTNYLDYARREENGNIKEQILKHINAWVCRIHCHKVIKLSDAVQPLPRQDTMFVHGVSPAFLRVGQQKAEAVAEGQHVWHKGAYFLGKVLWAKGYTELLDRLNEHCSRTGHKIDVDVYGSGPDLKAVEEEAARRELALKFNGARDHADSSLQDYKVFINPSLSDVVATTSAEALAMGKWVVCADHPSNRFFERFPNCLIYRNNEEFSTCLERALREEPQPMSAEDLHSLTWEAATERFLDVADKDPVTAPLESQLDKVLHSVHNTLTGMEFMRVAMGAGSKTRDLPARITDYQPDENDLGGFFDNSARAKKSWEGKKRATKPVQKAAEASPATLSIDVEAK